MALKQEINAIYKKHYNSLTRGKKAELTRFLNFIEMEIHLDPKEMAKILTCFLIGHNQIGDPLDDFIKYGKERKL